MHNGEQEQDYGVGNAGAFLAGLLLGGLLGAVVMLLLAPQSGRKTRASMRHEGKALRDQVAGTVEGAVTQTRDRAQRVRDSLQRQTKELRQRGQDMLDEQKEVVSTAVERGKTALHNVSKG
jgi:gas vesicle protein